MYQAKPVIHIWMFYYAYRKNDIYRQIAQWNFVWEEIFLVICTKPTVIEGEHFIQKIFFPLITLFDFIVVFRSNCTQVFCRKSFLICLQLWQRRASGRATLSFLDIGKFYRNTSVWPDLHIIVVINFVWYFKRKDIFVQNNAYIT